MPIALIDTRKPGYRRPKTGTLATITANKIHLALDPAGRGFIVLADREPPTFIFWDGTLEELRVEADGAERVTHLPKATEPKALAEAFNLPLPIPRGIIEITGEEPAAGPQPGAVEAEIPSPKREPTISIERFPMTASRWLDLTMLDGTVYQIVECRRILSTDSNLPAEKSDHKEGFLNRAIAAVMDKLRKK